MRYCTLATLLLGLLLAGCVTSRPEVDTIEPLDGMSACRILVLPFENDSDFTNGGIIATRIFQAALFKETGIVPIPEGDVRNLYRQLRIPPTAQPDDEERRIMASRLDVDYLIRGRVITMTERRSRQGTDPDVALRVAIVRAADGRIFTSTYHRRQGSQYRKLLHFGAVDTITMLTRLVSEEIIDTWRRHGLQSCR